MSQINRQGAVAALSEGRKTLSHLDRARGPEDVAADIIDLWSCAEKALHALVGQESVEGQQLVRVARQGEVISLDQAHALLEFLAARDRVNRTSYSPTPGDSEAARAGFAALDAAAAGNSSTTAAVPAVSQSPYAPVSSQASQRAGAIPYSPASSGNVSREDTAARASTGDSMSGKPPGGRGAFPLWLKLGIPLLLLALMVGGYFLTAGRNSSSSTMSAGITAMQNGQREAARRIFAQAARDNDKLADPHIFLARLSREDGDLATARAQLDEALRLEPRNHVALREMGLVMFASRNYDVARRFFVRAAAYDSTDRAALGYLGCALTRLNRTVEAAKFLGRAGNGAWSACAQPVQITPPPL